MTGVIKPNGLIEVHGSSVLSLRLRWEDRARQPVDLTGRQFFFEIALVENLDAVLAPEDVLRVPAPVVAGVVLLQLGLQDVARLSTRGNQYAVRDTTNPAEPHVILAGTIRRIGFASQP